MARKSNRTATVAPQAKEPLVPYASVDRLNFWQYDVQVVDPAKPFTFVYRGKLIGRDHANAVAKRILNRYLRKQSYKQEPATIYRAKGGAY